MDQSAATLSRMTALIKSAVERIRKGLPDRGRRRMIARPIA